MFQSPSSHRPSLVLEPNAKPAPVTVPTTSRVRPAATWTQPCPAMAKPRIELAMPLGILAMLPQAPGPILPSVAMKPSEARSVRPDCTISRPAWASLAPARPTPPATTPSASQASVCQVTPSAPPIIAALCAASAPTPTMKPIRPSAPTPVPRARATRQITPMTMAMSARMSPTSFQKFGSDRTFQASDRKSVNPSTRSSNQPGSGGASSAASLIVRAVASAAVVYSVCSVRARSRMASSSSLAVSYAFCLSFLSSSCSSFSFSESVDVSFGNPSRVPFVVLTFCAAAAASSSSLRARVWKPSRLVSQPDSARWAELIEPSAFLRYGGIFSTDFVNVSADLPTQIPSDVPILLSCVCAVPLSRSTRPIAETISRTVSRSPGAGSNPRWGYFDEPTACPPTLLFASRRWGDGSSR